MKFEIDIENSQQPDTIFMTKEEFDADSRSPAGQSRREKMTMDELYKRKANYRFFQYPPSFPCAYFHSWTWNNPNGPYEEIGVFLPIKVSE